MEEETYRGPSSVQAGLGQGAIDSTAGTIVGAVGGAVVGALIHNGEKVAEAAGKTGFRAEFTRAPKSTKALFGAVMGGAALNLVTQITGYFSGTKKADEGRAQFERLSAENELLRTQLADVQRAAQHSKSYVTKVALERENSSASDKGVTR